jgi:hypothetical protein
MFQDVAAIVQEVERSMKTSGMNGGSEVDFSSLNYKTIGWYIGDSLGRLLLNFDMRPYLQSPNDFS